MAYLHPRTKPQPPDSSWRRSVRMSLHHRGFERINCTSDTLGLGVYEETYENKHALAQIVVRWGPRAPDAGLPGSDPDHRIDALVGELAHDLRQAFEVTKRPDGHIAFRHIARILLSSGWGSLEGSVYKHRRKVKQR